MSVQAITWALEQKVGNTPSKLVLLCLANRAGFDSTCFPSVKLLSDETELSSRTIIRALAYLERNKFVSRTRQIRSNGSKANNLYTLHMVAPKCQPDTTPLVSQGQDLVPIVSPRSNKLNRHINLSAPKKLEEKIHVPFGTVEFRAWETAPSKIRRKALPARDGGFWVPTKVPA